MSATRTRLIPASDPEDMPDTNLLHRDPSQSIAGGRQHAVSLISIHPSFLVSHNATLYFCFDILQADLTAELIEEVVPYTCSISTGPLLPREEQSSWLKRLEDKLRRIYRSITCTRNTDVLHQHASHLPPRPPMQQHQPRQPHQQGPRPRITPTPTTKTSPPNQPGGSNW